MSAEDSKKANAIPEPLERAIAHLAKVTVQQGLDPGRMLAMLMRVIHWRNTVWPTLTDHQKREVLALLKHIRQHGQMPTPKGRRTDRKG